MRRPMKRPAVLASLLLAVCALAGERLTADGDIAMRSYDRVVVIAIDSSGDGAADEAFVVGLDARLAEAIDLRARGHIEVEGCHVSMRGLALNADHVIGVAHYPRLAETLPLDHMPKSADDPGEGGWARAKLHVNW
jgi:hypothetical protein